MNPLPFLLLALPALAAELPAPPPASALTPGPLHSATNLAPAEARAALSSALPSPSEGAVASLLAPDERPLPEFETSGWWVDAVALPLGIHETGAAAMDAPSSLLLCTPEHARAVVWRWRRGTGPRAVPLDLEHDSATNAEAYALMGRVAGAYFDEARGAVFRIELTPAGADAVTNGAPPRLSPELAVLTASTAVNAAIGVEGGDRIAIPWALRSLSLTRDPALPTTLLSAASLRPLSQISVYPRSR